MRSDRPSLRGEYRGEKTSALTWLICALLAVFIVQFALSTNWLRSGSQLSDAFALSVPAVRDLRLWTLLTYSFLHDTQFIFHILVNVGALFLLGRELIPMLGTRRFMGLYAAATIVGGLAWTAVHWRFGGNQTLIGATAAVDALFIVFVCFFPNQELNFLLFFLFPVTLKPKHVAAALVALDAVALVAWELPGLKLPYGATYASSAHLGGMLTGFLFYRYIYDNPWFNRRHRPGEIELPRWLRRPGNEGDGTPASFPPPPPLPDAPANPGDVRAEVDRILDKINSQGFGSLTEEERRILDEARHQISRR
ncbi:rhomboid family intramembrane serine protease [Opitutus sp. ER46]|uniref:rhomboid family intramembrane serine protease n=1 Tax=Opitutus sp. ER46 TaxID=2161864 RepID=UPI000D2FE2AD|nr:rhomboid family intramembrane serine protease [Opitutus sp. ER46]PTX90854.1 hypothetical protein DB354_19575 [Opitutus sp. ER46]